MHFTSARQAIHVAYSIHLGSPNKLEFTTPGTKVNNIAQQLDKYEAGHIIAAVEALPQPQKELLIHLYGPGLFAGRNAHARTVQLLCDYIAKNDPNAFAGTLTDPLTQRLWALMDIQLTNHQRQACSGKYAFTKGKHFCDEAKRRHGLAIEAHNFNRKWDRPLKLALECIDKMEAIALPKVAAAVVKVWHLQSEFVDTSVMSDEQAAGYLTHNEVRIVPSDKAA